MMFKINDEFSFKPYLWGWQLTQMKNGNNPKTKQPTITPKLTYHSTIKQVCDKVLLLSAAECTSMEELKALFDNASSILVEKCND
jgi:hypothetical protein